MPNNNLLPENPKFLVRLSLEKSMWRAILLETFTIDREAPAGTAMTPGEAVRILMWQIERERIENGGRVRRCIVCGCHDHDPCFLMDGPLTGSCDPTCGWMPGTELDICSNPICVAWAKTHRLGDKPDKNTIRAARQTGHRRPANSDKEKR